MTKLYIAADQALAVLTLNVSRTDCELKLANRKAQCVAIDPQRPEQVYCGTFGHGLWYSSDQGQSWRPAGEGITHDKVLSVAVSPTEQASQRGVVYAGTEPSAVFRSEDGGSSWQGCPGLSDLPSSDEWSFPPRPETHHVRWLHPDPHRSGRLFAAIEAGALIRSPDSGATWWDRVPTGPIDTHQLATHSNAPGRLYSAAGDGYFESTDAGEIWRRMEEGLQHNYVWSVAVASNDPETIIISSAASARHSHDKQNAESFLYRRAGNLPWQPIHDGLPDSAGRRTAVVATSPNEAGTFYAVWESDVFCSTDAGASWHQLDIPWPTNFEVNEPRALMIVPD